MSDQAPPPAFDENPPAPRTRMSRRGRFFRIASITLLVLVVIGVLLVGWVYWQAVQTFEVRRVSLPTRIYADKFELRPGRTLSAAELDDRLERLGYRAAEGSPPDLTQPGVFMKGEDGWTIHLRAFEHPAGDQEAAVVRLAIAAGAIASVDTADGAAAEVALEPELLTSVLSENLENRRPVALDQVPQHLVDSVIVTEDVRFFQHPGVDPIGLFRALFRNVRAGGVEEGGSTLTQQLVKNYYLTGERTLRRKAVEAVMSLILDAKYSKREILESYLNDIYLGRNRSISIMGVGEAARYFFGKPVAELTPAESALIAGMIRSPNNYNPFEEPDAARRRRKVVADLLLSNEKITQEEHKAILAAPLPEKPTVARAGLSSIPYYLDAVLAELRTAYGFEEVRGRGLSVYTAIDLSWQNTLGEQLEDGLERLEKQSRRLRNADEPIQGAAIAVDVETGEVRALVGGRDYTQSQFNRAIRAERQVGSLFKPFVLLAAFEPSLSGQTITPATQVNDSKFVVQRRFSRDWSPGNYEGRYYGVVTVRRALEQSLNAAFVRIGLSVGLGAIARAARAVGVEQEIDQVPSMILGSVTVPPLQMAESYTTMARMGSRVPLHTIRYVAREGGRDPAGAGEIEPVQVFPARDVFLAVHLMEGVMNRGTAARARALGFRKPAAGKTGTTNDKRDAWFIGFTPRTLGLVWVGFDGNQPTGLSGSDAAVPIWARMMSRITDGQPASEFPVPAGIQFAQIDATTGGLATEFCPREAIVNEAFKSGTTPARPCQEHRPSMPPIDPLTGLPYQAIDPTTGLPYSTDPALGPLPGIDVSPSDPQTPVLDGGIDTFRRDPAGTPPPTSTLPPDVTPVSPPVLSPREPLPAPDDQDEEPDPPPPEPEGNRQIEK